MRRVAALGVPALLALAAGAAGIGAAILGGRLIQSGPNWWQSLAARPYLALAETGIDMGDPAFWVLPVVAPFAGALWAYAVTHAIGRATLRPVMLSALAFAVTLFIETRATPWWLASFVPAADGQERMHLLLAIAEAVFVVAVVSSGVLAWTLGLRGRAIGVAVAAALAATIGALIVYLALDLVGLRVGTGNGAMVRVTIASTAFSAAAGGAALCLLLRDQLPRKDPPR